VLEAHWHLRGHWSAVTGERDTNFRLDSDRGRYLVKVTHPDESAQAVAAQVDVLEHLLRVDPDLPVQTPLRSVTGPFTHPFPADPRRQVRVVKYLEGTLRRHAPWQADFAAQTGLLAARLDRALQSFSHPGCRQSLLWDLRRAEELKPLRVHLRGDPLADTVDAVLERFVSARARLNSLAVQPIHNDLNPSNLLVDSGAPVRLCGIIDFGDMIEAPRIQELAVACAYLTDAEDPIGAIGDCAAAFHAHAPLSALELSLLGDLVATRWAITVLITEWRARLQPDNAPYILRNNAASRRGLTLFDNAGRHRLAHRLEELRT
jgi:Ser/Thr protein kinase RdoA (MazF antagonist)